MKGEFHNFLWCCLNPILCARAILFFARRILYSFQYRYAPIVLQYPKKVRETFERISPLSEVECRVGGRRGMEVGEPDWRREFDDPEQTMYVHRWGWLIYDQMGQEQGVALMRSWLAAMGSAPKGIAGTSYTTSERVVNALLFLAPHPALSPRERGWGEGISDDLRASLVKMAHHLARNIEYHGARGTGNHIVNNARALFFTGQILDAKSLSDLAFAILKDALPRLVTKDGFLREESSHYHLLFTRWIVEIHKLAKKTGHKEIENYLELWVEKLVRQCWFFIVETPTPPSPPSGRGGDSPNWQIPLIGDVSPDCTPEWLIKYLYQSLRGGVPPFSGGIRAFPESGWFRLDWKNSTIFWHIPQTNMIHRPTHGHADACSFALFHKGKPILIDPGRPAYQSNEGCLGRDHNALTIDGFDLFLYDRAQKFPAFYQKRDVKYEWWQEGKQFIFSIFHTGFRRLAGDVIDHTRRFCINDGSLEIEDELRGKKIHTIETFFHFAPGSDKIDVQHSVGEHKTIPGWTSPSYGVTIPSTSIVVQSKAQLPAKLNYCLQLS